VSETAPDASGTGTGGAAPEAAPHRHIHPAWRVAQVALVAATAYFVIAYLVRTWSSLRDFARTFSPGWLALSAAAFLAFYFLQALAWWLLLRAVAVRSPLPLAVATWSKSILARYIPGNVFMFVGRAWMSHEQGLPVDRVTAAMVYEQALQVCSALVVAALLFPFWEWQRGLTSLSLVAVPVIVALLHPRAFGPIAAWGLRLLHRPPLEATMSFVSVLAVLAYYVVAWVPAGLGAWLLARAVTGLAADALPLVLVAYVLAYVIGMAAFIFPSGIGVREAVLGTSLSRELPGGVALAWALLLRLWVTVVELAFVGLAVLVELAVRRRRERM
jgi:glycosyltransferase 2 family protein